MNKPLEPKQTPNYRTFWPKALLLIDKLRENRRILTEQLEGLRGLEMKDHQVIILHIIWCW